MLHPLGCNIFFYPTTLQAYNMLQKKSSRTTEIQLLYIKMCNKYYLLRRKLIPKRSQAARSNSSRAEGSAMRISSLAR